MNQLTSFQRGTLNSTRTAIVGSPTRQQGWSLDALGNFASQTTDGTTQTRTHNQQNEITSVSGATTPAYDLAGNLKGDETGKQFVYDAWNRLVQVKDSGGNTLETFTYDGAGRRVTTTASGTTTAFYYSSAWQVLEERVGASPTTPTAQYIWSPVYVDALVRRDTGTSLLVNQTFTAPDGTALTALGWTAVSGTFQVSGNAATPASGNNNDYTVLDAGASNYTLTCDVTPQGSYGNERDPDLLVRYTDSMNFWVVDLNLSLGALRLLEVVNGAAT